MSKQVGRLSKNYFNSRLFQVSYPVLIGFYILNIMDYNKNLDLSEIEYFCEFYQVLKKENWRDILNYEGTYQVSDLGRVKSLNYNHTKKPKILKLSNNIHGYKTISLCKNNVKKTYSIQQLVATAFLNHITCKFDLVVNHKNFIRTDNKISNLEIITHRENTNRKHLKSSSIYTGVGWHKRIKKWQSRIVVKRKINHLGYFENEIDAHNAYQKALKNLTLS